MREQKGITLIALVITIIVLLILAGVTIAMLVGENGILNNANASSSSSAYYGADEQMRLAYMSVRAEIMSQTVKDSGYSPVTHVDDLANVVRKDLGVAEDSTDKSTEGWTVTTTSAGLIQIRYDDTHIYEHTVNDSKPQHNGYVNGVIQVVNQTNAEGQTANYYFDDSTTH